MCWLLNGSLYLTGTILTKILLIMQALLRVFSLSIGLCAVFLPSWTFAEASQVLSSAECKPIHTAEELANIGRESGFPLDGIYSLEKDLDLSQVVFESIGSEKKPFQGTFYGNGHSLMHLSIKSNRDYTGLFGLLGKRALIQDLVIQKGEVQGKAYTGLLAGCNQGTIKNCYAAGQVRGTNNVGGLVGINGQGGQIDASQAIGEVKGRSYEVGGLVGCNLGYIVDSRSEANVEGIRLVGGMVGTNDETGQILHCIAFGRVSGKYWVGGLVGHNWFRGQIIHCMAKAIVIGEEYVGGLVGFNYAQACITKSSSTSTVQGDQHVGMVVGGNRGVISYALGIEDKWSDSTKKLTKPLINATNK
jgi:hypothetical protein